MYIKFNYLGKLLTSNMIISRISVNLRLKYGESEFRSVLRLGQYKSECSTKGESISMVT
jgi:hypothetical protein